MRGQRALLVTAVSTVLIVAGGLPSHAAGPAQAPAAAGSDDGVIISTRFTRDANDPNTLTVNPQIVSVDPESGKARVLTRGHWDGSPDLSPDGRSIVFWRCRHALNCDQLGADVNIWTMHADGTGQKRLTDCDNTRCIGAVDPSFSPDGRRIVFVEDRYDAHQVNFNNVFVMDSDGTHLRQITTSAPDNPPAGQPHFSPDGKFVVFQRETADGSGQRLMIVRADGTGQRALLPNADAFAPAWSPDGTRIAFTLIRHATDGSVRVDVATVHPDGTGLKLLTHDSPDVASVQPDYSPTGTRIVYTHALQASCQLAITDPAGARPRVLPAAATDCYIDASWGRKPS